MMINDYKNLAKAEEKDEGKTLDLYLYGEVYDGFDIDVSDDGWLQFVKNKNCANYFAQELAKHPNAEQINLYINSPGGYCDEGITIGNMLKRNKAHVTAYIDGFASSIASVIACSADEVIMFSNSLMFVHPAWNHCEGNAAAMRKCADDLDKITASMCQTYKEKSNGKISDETLAVIVDNESYLSAQQCLEYGLCDKIYSGSDGSSMAKIMSNIKACNGAGIELGNLDMIIDMFAENHVSEPKNKRPKINIDAFLADKFK